MKQSTVGMFDGQKLIEDDLIRKKDLELMKKNNP